MPFNIIANNISVGGGKELLDYLLASLEKKNPNMKVTLYLSSGYVVQEHPSLSIKRSGSLFWKIALFFKKLDNALYFGNIPPFFKSKNSILYLQNLYLLQPLSEQPSFAMKIRYAMMKLQLWFCINNVDKVCVQTAKVAEMVHKFKSGVNVEVLPFFDLPAPNLSRDRVYEFCYISYPYPHKNYHSLLDAVDILEADAVSCAIAVTVPNEPIFDSLLAKIELLSNNRYARVVNMGHISKLKAQELYESANALVFVSSKETFGLPLIEAANAGCDVISVRLPHLEQILEPSLVIESASPQEIANAMAEYLTNGSKKPKIIVKDGIDNLISFFRKEF